VKWRSGTAYLDLLEKRADADMVSLYWWRRDAAREDTDGTTPLAQRLLSLAERGAPAMPAIVELPGNRMRANAAARRAREAQALKDKIATDPALLDALQHERRNAMVALATGLVATAAPAAATIYAATTQQPVALCLAMAGTFAASLRALSRDTLVPADALRRLAERIGVTHEAQKLPRHSRESGSPEQQTGSRLRGHDVEI
jgi:hypothetical protein